MALSLRSLIPEWLTASLSPAGGADGVGVEVLSRTNLALGIVLTDRVFRQVGMGKPAPTFLQVPRSFEFHRAGEPLVRFQGHGPFAYRGCPPSAVMGTLVRSAMSYPLRLPLCFRRSQWWYRCQV